MARVSKTKTKITDLCKLQSEGGKFHRKSSPSSPKRVQVLTECWCWISTDAVALYAYSVCCFCSGLAIRNNLKKYRYSTVS